MEAENFEDYDGPVEGPIFGKMKPVDSLFSKVDQPMLDVGDEEDEVQYTLSYSSPAPYEGISVPSKAEDEDLHDNDYFHKLIELHEKHNAQLEKLTFWAFMLFVGLVLIVIMLVLN